MRIGRLGAGTLAVTLGLGLAACGDDDDPAAMPPVYTDSPTGPAVAASPDPTASPGRSPGRSPSAGKPTVTGDVVTGLTSPWGLAFLPDGSALVSERDTAKIQRVSPGGKVSTVGTVPGVDHGGEGGLLGIAVGPDFETNPRLYAYFTASDGNRIVRMSYAADNLGRPEVILDGIDASGIHNGGRLAFGPDGMLYASTGDAADRPTSQDRADLNGKILRMTPDGKPAPGNPDPDSVVWSYGHRNVQGLAWDDADQLWASEFGQNTWDELNRIQAGRNYGWPEVEGDEGGSEFTRPARVWPTSEASPSGLAFAGGSLWMAALRGQRLWQIPVTGTGTGKPVAHFEGEYGRLRTVALAPDGSLWLITNNTDGRGRPADGDDRILRITLG
ncbi:PQQ-dependent sugar dehydrogenase [Sporichthya polymorpha]|uniref:PQQ-dependent sugar dehydrogenase n=1 Tax=Sporichthya polymorpha TaxID=35751 RepID=UPI0003788AB3|nr:PQQ-dependent sugar dehydrogenase [Sporichthya polymorpha]